MKLADGSGRSSRRLNMHRRKAAFSFSAFLIPFGGGNLVQNELSLSNSGTGGIS
jgi:hypothetical protein